MIFYPCNHIESQCSFTHAQAYWISHSVTSDHVQVGSQAYLPPDFLPVIFPDLFTGTASLLLTFKQQQQQQKLARTWIHRIISRNSLLLLYFSDIHKLQVGLFLSLWRKQREHVFWMPPVLVTGEHSCSHWDHRICFLVAISSSMLTS